MSGRPEALERPPAAQSAEPLHDWIEVTTVGDLLVRAAARRGDADALVFPGGRQSYAELLASSERFAASLAALGVERGDTVAILMPNCLDYAHAFFGCALLGVRALLVNARYKEHELSYVLRDADVVAIVTTDLVSEYVDFVPVIERATVDPPPLLRHRIMLGASSPEGYLDRAAFDAASARVPDRGGAPAAAAPCACATWSCSCTRPARPRSRRAASSRTSRSRGRPRGSSSAST